MNNETTFEKFKFNLVYGTAYFNNPIFRSGVPYLTTYNIVDIENNMNFVQGIVILLKKKLIKINKD